MRARKCQALLLCELLGKPSFPQLPVALSVSILGLLGCHCRLTPNVFLLWRLNASIVPFLITFLGCVGLAPLTALPPLVDHSILQTDKGVAADSLCPTAEASGLEDVSAHGGDAESLVPSSATVLSQAEKEWKRVLTAIREGNDDTEGIPTRSTPSSTAVVIYRPGQEPPPFLGAYWPLRRLVTLTGPEAALRKVDRMIEGAGKMDTSGKSEPAGSGVAALAAAGARGLEGLGEISTEWLRFGDVVQGGVTHRVAVLYNRRPAGPLAFVWEPRSLRERGSFSRRGAGPVGRGASCVEHGAIDIEPRKGVIPEGGSVVVRFSTTGAAGICIVEEDLECLISAPQVWHCCCCACCWHGIKTMVPWCGYLDVLLGLVQDELMADGLTASAITAANAAVGHRVTGSNQELRSHASASQARTRLPGVGLSALTTGSKSQAPTDFKKTRSSQSIDPPHIPVAMKTTASRVVSGPPPAAFLPWPVFQWCLLLISLFLFVPSFRCFLNNRRHRPLLLAVEEALRRQEVAVRLVPLQAAR